MTLVSRPTSDYDDDNKQNMTKLQINGSAYRTFLESHFDNGHGRVIVCLHSWQLLHPPKPALS